MAVPEPPAITALPPAPNVEAGKAAFNAAANLFVPALPGFGVELNDLADWVEARANEIETAANAVEDDATAAAASATAAEGFKGTAEAAAAAAGAAAGLPSLTGNARKALVVNAAADGVTWGEVMARASLPVTYGGTANAITLTSGLGIGGTIPTGLEVRFRATAANTGATTIALDGGSAIACRTINETSALPAGYVRSGVETRAFYSGTHWVLDREAEYGSNANGAFLRLANGWMVVTKQLTGLGPISTATGALFTSGGITVGTLAAEFAAPPVREAAPFGTLTSQIAPGTAATTTTGGTVALNRPINSSATDYGVDLTFTGTWY